MTSKRQAIIRAIVFWAGFFASLFLTRFIGGILGEKGTAGQWYGAAIMIVLSIVWTRLCLRMDHCKVDPGIGFSRQSIPRTLLGIAFAIPLCSVSLICLKWFVPGVGFGFQGFASRQIFASVLLYLALAAYEEIGFRGYPLARLLPSFGVWPTLLLIAPLFVAYHLSMGWSFVQAAIGTGVGSLLFGMAAICKRGLAFPIGVHAGWNFTTWCLMSGNGPWKAIIPPNLVSRAQTVGMVVYVVCMLIGTALLWLWSTQSQQQPEIGTASGEELNA